MQVECVEGFDGGLPQGFLLELVEMPALRLVRNLSLSVSILSNHHHHRLKCMGIVCIYGIRLIIHARYEMELQK